MSEIDWDKIEREGASSKRRRTYTSRVCPRCGRTISEGCFSGRDGNWWKHAKACFRENEEE